MRLERHVAHMGKKRNAYMLMVRKPEGKRLLGKPECRWVDNISLDLGEIVRFVWIGLTWLRIRRRESCLYSRE
jgi:hypothetical protein